ncbi:uroporphyrinogen-III C-methyltransferase [Eleftheria terrae]|uniref:uroporphyrinogen-III C-methyltransferase n=1 Tax=Eleftheria terrae TaxID=1597781 RepID=UPI00263A6DF4|nr:uroporphyrinogen-III C-methyltransferase [Eleftheria terrae]WKB55939.1 uroporphyrinogen-III C-methyltransferase [Eleftheria terrae]
MTLLTEPLHFTPGAAPAARRPARVTLVGAGPGDPELLTVKAAKALQAAQLVLYDHLVSREVLQLVRPDADLVYVGKESGHHTLPQEDIAALMVRLAQSGRSVLRLKGGDPYIFGRGGEEAQALAAAGVPFEVIPGISAAQGAAAAAGIPLTHRDHAESLVLTTGHLRGEGAQRSADLDWATLARARQTVVIYMGVSTLPTISEQLQAHGLAADTPAALVERATLPEQRTVVGTLATLPALAREHEVRSPALIVIGTVVALRQVLSPSAAEPLSVT